MARVDTPFRNSWADKMIRKVLFISPTRPENLHPTHQEEQKFMNKTLNRGGFHAA